MREAGLSELNRAALAINLQDALEIATVGVRRAHAFMAIGLKALEPGPLRSASLPMAFGFRFLPDPLSDEMSAKLTAEYSSWLVGSGLRELDQYFCHFLDRVWWITAVADLHGKAVASNHVIGGKFSQDTNVARKMAKVVERIASEKSRGDCFDAFSRARNALGHGAGQVRQRDVIDGRSLNLRWVCPEAIIRQNGVDETFGGDGPSWEVTDPNGAEIFLKFVERTKEIPIGEKIEFSPHELSEICFFYYQQAIILIKALEEFLALKGIIVSSTTQDIAQT